MGEEFVGRLGVFTVKIVSATSEQGVDLVDEDHTPVELLFLGEQLVDLLRGLVDPFALDIASAQFEVWVAEFTGDGPGEMCFSSAWWAI
nr:hypothetical protein [Haladaptatus halobius]